jgi:hypothetical protein
MDLDFPDSPRRREEERREFTAKIAKGAKKRILEPAWNESTKTNGILRFELFSFSRRIESCEQAKALPRSRARQKAQFRLLDRKTSTPVSQIGLDGVAKERREKKVEATQSRNGRQDRRQALVA